jgi:hypothetical protein
MYIPVGPSPHGGAELLELTFEILAVEIREPGRFDIADPVRLGAVALRTKPVELLTTLERLR